MPNKKADQHPAPPVETPQHEHDRVRSSNDRDQRLERDGKESKHNRGYDEAADGRRASETDPDSPNADINRDDMIDEP
jgi:hypothetical protein